MGAAAPAQQFQQRDLHRFSETALGADKKIWRIPKFSFGSQSSTYFHIILPIHIELAMLIA